MLKKVIFIVDNKLRDFGSLSLVALHLESINISCEYIGTTDLTLTWFRYKDCLIILNKPSFPNIPVNLMRSRGVRFASINTEGAMGSAYLDRSCLKLDLIFFWNRGDFDLFSARFPDYKGETKVIGTIRTDSLYFLRFLRRLTRIHGKPTVLLTSPGGYLDRSIRFNKYKRKQLSKLSADSVNFELLLEVEKNGKDFLFEIGEWLNSNEYNVLFKPHPNENGDIWRQRFSHCDFVTVVNESIDRTLRGVDLIIGLDYCQSLFDARLAGVHTVGISVPGAVELFPADWLRAADVSFDGISDLFDYLVNLDSDLGAFELKKGSDNQLDEIVARFFYKFDGKRAMEHAQYLTTMFFMKAVDREDIRIDTFMIELVRGAIVSLKSYILITLYQFGILKLRHKNSFSLARDVDNFALELNLEYNLELERYND